MISVIGNSTSTFDTGPGGPNAFARPGSPFFPLENAEVQGNGGLGPEEAAGLQLFLDYAADLGLAPRRRQLEFFP